MRAAAEVEEVADPGGEGDFGFASTALLVMVSGLLDYEREKGGGTNHGFELVLGVTPSGVGCVWV